MENAPHSPRARRLGAAVAAGALALLGAAAVAGPAHADTAGGNVPAGPYTLTITKLQNPASNGTAANGTQQNVGSLTPIAGVNYSVAPVNGVDLTTAAGWTTASTLSVNSAGVVVDTSGNTYTTGTASPLTATNSSGVTTYTTSTADVYEVTETSAPAGTQLAEPFLVTLPLPQNNNWLTNVYVYPKNTVEGAPVKTVDDSAAHGVGDTVNWKITSTVPNQASGDPLTQYTISDALDARLTPPAASAITVSLASATGTAITLPAADYTASVTGQNVKVDFTAAGLTLLTSNPSAVITVGVPTVVNSVGTGTITNTANQTIEAQNQSAAITTPSAPAQTTWGDVTLHKQDPNGNALAGAQFEVFASQADAKNLANPVSVNGATTFTSDSNGTVAINGLKAQLDGQGADLKYYVVETKAPAGYYVAAAFAQSVGGDAITVAPGGSAANATVDVTDPQDPPIALPLTGSTGTTVFVSGGVAVAAAAIALAIVLQRRRRREPEAAVVASADAAL